MDLKTASVRRDIVLMVIVAGAAAYACAKFNLSEALLNWTRPFERLQLDELPAILLVIAICLINFGSVILQCGAGACHTSGYRLLSGS